MRCARDGDRRSALECSLLCFGHFFQALPQHMSVTPRVLDPPPPPPPLSPRPCHQVPRPSPSRAPASSPLTLLPPCAPTCTSCPRGCPRLGVAAGPPPPPPPPPPHRPLAGSCLCSPSSTSWPGFALGCWCVCVPRSLLRTPLLYRILSTLLPPDLHRGAVTRNVSSHPPLDCSRTHARTRPCPLYRVLSSSPPFDFQMGTATRMYPLFSLSHPHARTQPLRFAPW